MPDKTVQTGGAFFERLRPFRVPALPQLPRSAAGLPDVGRLRHR